MTVQIKAVLMLASVTATGVGASYVWGAQSPSDSPREEAYQQKLEEFRHQFAAGTSRQALRRTFSARGIAFEDPDMVIPVSGRDDLLVKIGEDPSPYWYCSAEWVYIDMRFASSTDGRRLDLQSPLQSMDLLRQNRECL